MSGQIARAEPKLQLWRRALLKALRVDVRYGAVADQLQRSPCIVICNHVSLLDGVIIALASPRPMVFPVTPKHSKANPWTKSVLQWLQHMGLGVVVPMDRSSYFAIRTLLRSINTGNSVCIFPEGKIADGEKSQIHGGYSWLANKTDAVVVTATISGAERSRIFARQGSELWPAIRLDL